MKHISLAVLLCLSFPSFAKTSTDLFLCGGLEIGVAALNAVASLCSDHIKFNQTDTPKIDQTLKASTVSYGVSSGLMALAGMISIIDSRIDYGDGRTTRTVPWVITGTIFGAVLSSVAGMITSGISFEDTHSSSMLGTSLGSTVANLMAFIGALRWSYYMKVLVPNAPNV